jgi:hypothetical protein
MKKLLGRLFALGLVTAAIVSVPATSEAACCTAAEKMECRVSCAEIGCVAQITCPQNTCGCFCLCN